MTTRYVHTNIVSEDWQALARFYQEVFDCQPVPPQRNLSGDWLTRGTGVPGAAFQGMHLRLPGYGEDGPTLEIYQYSVFEPNDEPIANRKGYGHIAFRVDDVTAVRDEVLKRGGAELGQIVEADLPGVGHLTFVYLTDPEGNILEIQNWS